MKAGKCLRVIFAIGVFLLLGSSLRASHIVGGEIEYTCLGNDYYRVVLTIFRDNCSSGSIAMPPTLDLEVMQLPNTAKGTYTLSKGPSTFRSPSQPACGATVPNVCVESAEYILDSLHLPQSPQGYLVYHQQCCRSGGVGNVLNAWREGMTMDAYIYNTGVCNNSVSFSKYPPVVLPTGVPLGIPAGGTDPDADSLFFEFCTPLGSQGAAPNFTPVNLASPYSSSYQVPSNPSLQIDSQTGRITGSISQNGKFSVGVCVTEYRNGQPVGKTRRDYQFTSVTPWSLFASIQSKTDAGCGQAGGATVAAGGVNGPYLYQWSNGETGATASNLTAGTHYVVVTGSGGCRDTAYVTIGTSGGPKIKIVSMTNASCGQPNGSATISVNGGQPPYTINWPDGSIGLSNQSLAAGSHQVQISDASGCNSTATVQINSSPGLQLSLKNKTNESCPSAADASIDLQVTGGTQPYSYQWSNGATSQDISGVHAGYYQIVVTDSLGCSDSLNVRLLAGPAPVIDSIQIQDVSCAGAEDAAISVFARGPNLRYSWRDGTQGSSRSGLSAGSYTVYLSNGSSCLDSLTAQVQSPDTLTLEVDSLYAAACSADSAFVSLKAGGGKGPYTFNWSDGKSGPQRKLGVKPLSVSVTDAMGCSESMKVSVNAGSTIQLQLQTLVNPSCQGSADGRLAVGVSGGKAPYSFQWNNGDTTASISQLSGGHYILTVTDSLGCQAGFDTVLTEPDSLMVQLKSLQDPSCAGQKDGGISISVKGGTWPYQFNWSHGSGDSTLQGLTAGNYQLNLVDANGCSLSRSFQLTDPDSLYFLVDSLSPASCGQSNASVKLVARGGQPAYTFSWDDGAMGPTRSGLAAGWYAFTLSDSACQLRDSIYISALGSGLQVGIDSMASPACAGDSSGFLKLAIQNGQSPFSYRWSNGLQGPQNSNLKSGPGWVLVTDASGCMDSLTFNIPRSTALQLSIDSILDPNCAGAADGQINVSASGGHPPYQYAWSNGMTGPGIRSLAAGSYTLTVTDTRSCTISKTLTLQASDSLQLQSDSIVAAGCGKASGEISVSISGGHQPYQYQWSNGDRSSTADSLSAGSYSLIVTDTKGCQRSFAFRVPNAGGFTLSLDSLTAATCTKPGRAFASVQGGGAPYSFLWSNGDTSTFSSSLTAGRAWLRVVDAYGCTDSLSFTIPQQSGPQITLDSLWHASCGDSLGGFELSVSGAASLLVNGLPSPKTARLSAGSHQAVVVDSNGCSDSLSFVILQNPAVNLQLDSLSPAGCGRSNGFASLDVSPGLQGIKWSNGQTTSAVGNLPSGAHWVTAANSSGCRDTLHFSITGTSALQAQIDSISGGCSASSGFVALSLSGGQAPYTVQWSNGNNGLVQSGLPTGRDTVVIRDSKGCEFSLDYHIPQSSSLNLVVDSLQMVSCSGQFDGKIAIKANGGQAPYTYSWSNGVNKPVNDSLRAGVYHLTLMDQRGCSVSDTFEITEPTLMRLNLDSISHLSCHGGSDGFISWSIDGGSAPYHFNWTDGSTGSARSGLIAATYGITVTDANGCAVQRSVQISEPDSISIQANLQNPLCAGARNGSIRLTLSGGTKPYSFNWSDGSTNRDRFNLASGSYTLQLSDANGCVASRTFELDSLSPIAVRMDSVYPSSCGAANGFASIVINGGAAPYTVKWPDGGLGLSNGTLGAGIHWLEITDANSCVDSFRLQVPAATPLKLSLDSVMAYSPCANPQSFARVQIDSGVGPFSMQWSNGVTGQSNSSLSGGAAWVVVTDSFACTDTLHFTMPAVKAMQLKTEVKLDPSCSGSSDGMLETFVTGGTAPFSFQWGNGATGNKISGLSAGAYQLTVSDARGCVVSHKYQLEDPAPFQVVVDSVTDPSFCEADGSVHLTVSDGDSIAEVIWVRGKQSSGATGFTGLGPGSYTLLLRNERGCETTINFNLREVLPMAWTTFAVDGKACGPNDSVSAQIAVKGGHPPYQYHWVDGFKGASRSDLEPGYYQISVIDSRGCHLDTTLAIEQVEMEYELELTAPPCGSSADATLTIQFQDLHLLQDVYLNGKSIQTYQGLELEEGFHQLEIIETAGCSFLEDFFVEKQRSGQLFVPNSFTPNADGINDEFKIVGDANCYGSGTLQVYNRWGELVFRSERLLEDFWDGTVRGERAPVGVYTYLLRAGNREERGTITLGR